MELLKAKGHRGSWFADVSGERLPCVHNHWWDKERGQYHDPFRRHGSEIPLQVAELIDAIQKGGKVVLTSDNVRYDTQGEVAGFQRTNYIAVYRVSDISFDPIDGLRFQFRERLCNLK